MFNNASTLGAFGEFVYSTFCRTQGLVCIRTNFCHTDFLVTEVISSQHAYVDVKTAEGNPTPYRGRRYHGEIVYEAIAVSNGIVQLTPDKLSLIRSSNPIVLGNLSQLYELWKGSTQKPEIKRISSDKIEHTVIRSMLAKNGYLKVRIVERGEASASRWTGTVDNLPGSRRTIEANDATVFIQYKCDHFRQIVARITLFPHNLIREGRVPMRAPTKRQANKGIDQVVDLESYFVTYSNLTFSDLDEFENFLVSDAIELKH